MIEALIREAHPIPDNALRPQLARMSVTRRVSGGNAAAEIVKTAGSEMVDIQVMGPHASSRRLQGTVQGIIRESRISD
jgi:hypothetical protein